MSGVESANAQRANQTYGAHGAETAGAVERGAPEGSEAGASLITDPVESGIQGDDPGIAVMMLVIKNARAEKKISKSIRECEERAQESADDAQLAAMREKAFDAYVGGLIGGAATVASGAATGAGAPMDAVMKQRCDAAGKVIEGTGKIASTFKQHEADEDGVEVTKQEQIASRHKRSADDAREATKDAKDLADRAVGYFKEYVTAKSEERRATLMRA